MHNQLDFGYIQYSFMHYNSVTLTHLGVKLGVKWKLGVILRRGVALGRGVILRRGVALGRGVELKRGVATKCRGLLFKLDHMSS